MTEAILKVENLSVRFGRNQVLRDLSFSVRPHSTLAIIGPNGAGKSVLLRALLGSIPSNGVIQWAPGTRIGYVPQKLDLERDLPITGYDLLRARVALSRGRSDGIQEMFDVVGISQAAADRLVGTYSGGQFQRLLIAFALLGKPTVLLLDEATAGVDEPGQEQLAMLLQRVQRENNLTVLFISHDLSVVSRYAEVVLCLGHGITCIGPPREILTPENLQEVYGMAVRYHVHER
jgi:zinc transport system ATP-binding protein